MEGALFHHLMDQTSRSFNILTVAPDIWLDASDTSTISLVSSAVSQWDDKSGNGRHVVQADATLQPIYTGDSIQFSNDYMLTNEPATWINNKEFICAAIIDVDAVSSSNYFVGTHQGGANKGLHLGYRNDTTLTHAHWSDDVNYSHSQAIGRYLYLSHFRNVGSEVRIDGASLGESSTLPTMPLSTDAQFVIGGALTSYYFAGQISELVLFDQSSYIEEIEGYLAHKWGRSDNLPSDHLYKVSPP